MRARGILMTAVLAGLVLAAPLQAAPIRGQTVEGSIQQEMPHPIYEDGCLMGVQYQYAWLKQPALNGYVGYQFEIEERTWGKPYKLVPSDKTADLDIGFFPLFLPVLVTADYEPHAARRPGGETGIVPRGMTQAIVCLYDGADVEFRYTTGK